jgi:hypothetical protein
MVLALCVVLLCVSCFSEPPIVLSSRIPVIPGLGLVLEITNASDKTIHRVTVELQAADGSTLPPILVSKTLEPHSTADLGPLQLMGTGWKIEAGQAAVISCHGYRRDLFAVVPEPGS